MTRRRLLNLAGPALVALLLAATARGAPTTVPTTAPAARPNVLVLIADDLGWGDVAFHRGATPTPNLDRFVRDGTELARFYAHPVCSPTRAALLTGQLPRRFGIVTPLRPRDPGVPAGVATLPAAFRAAGYHTSLVGKWHLGVASPPLASGFDHFYGFMGPEIDYFKHTNQRGDVDWQRDGKPVDEIGYSTFLIADEAVRQISGRDVGRPFYMQVAFNAPHQPIAAPPETVAKYADRGAGPATYAAMIDALDVGIGRVLSAVDKAGLRDDTLVLFFSDNGPERQLGSSGGLRAAKGSIYEGGIRTPAAVRWPGHVAAGGTSQMPVAAQDLFPTLLAAAGVPLPDGAKLDGRDVWPAIRDGKVAARDPLMVATADVALIDGDWKLVELFDGSRSLFDLANDPSERTDLLAARPEVAGRMGAKLTEMKKGLPAVAPPQRGPGSGDRRPPRGGAATRPAAL